MEDTHYLRQKKSQKKSEKPDALPKICQSQSATPTNADTHDHSHTLGDESSSNVKVRISWGWIQLHYTQLCSCCSLAAAGHVTYPECWSPDCRHTAFLNTFTAWVFPRPRKVDAAKCSSSHLKFREKSSWVWSGPQSTGKASEAKDE